MADLTPRLAMENGWTVTGHCDRCRVSKGIRMDALFAKMPDRDLGEALARGKLQCTKCERPCSALDVTKMGTGGLFKPVMKLTPGYTVTREEE